MLYFFIFSSVLAKTIGSEGLTTADTNTSNNSILSEAKATNCRSRIFNGQRIYIADRFLSDLKFVCFYNEHSKEHLGNDTCAPPKDHYTKDHRTSLIAKEIHEKDTLYTFLVTSLLIHVVLAHFLWNIYAQKTGCVPTKTFKTTAENKLSPHMKQMKSASDEKVIFSEGTQNVDIQGNVVNFTINNHGSANDKTKKKQMSRSFRRRPIIKLHSCGNRPISKIRSSSESDCSADSDSDNDDNDMDMRNTLKRTQVVPVQETSIPSYYSIMKSQYTKTVISVDSKKTRPADLKIDESLNNVCRQSVVCQSSGSEENQRISEPLRIDNGQNIDYKAACAEDKSITTHVAVDTNALSGVAGIDHESFGYTNNNHRTFSKSVTVSSLSNNNFAITHLSNLKSAGSDPCIFKTVRPGHGQKSFHVIDESPIQADALHIPDPDLQYTHIKQVYGSLHRQESQQLPRLLDAAILDDESSIGITSRSRKSTASSADEVDDHENIGNMKIVSFKKLDAQLESDEIAPPKDTLCERPVTGTFVSDIAARTFHNLEVDDIKTDFDGIGILAELNAIDNMKSLIMELHHKMISSSKPNSLDKVGKYKELQGDYLKSECTPRSSLMVDTSFIGPEIDIPEAYFCEPSGQAIAGYNSLLLLSAKSFAVSAMSYDDDYLSHRDFKECSTEINKSALTNKLTLLNKHDSPIIAHPAILQNRVANSSSDERKYMFSSLGHQDHASSDDTNFSKIHRKENPKSCYTETFEISSEYPYEGFSLVLHNYNVEQNQISGTSIWTNIANKQETDVIISFNITKLSLCEISHLYNTGMDSGIASLEDTPSVVCMSKKDTIDIKDVGTSADVQNFPTLDLLEKSTRFFSTMPAKNVQDNLNLSFRKPLISKQRDMLILVDLELTQFTKALVREIHPRHGSFSIIPRFFVLDRYFMWLQSSTPPTREQRLRYEWLRLASFSNYQGNGHALALARNGFYHDSSQGPNATRCIYCGATHSTWNLFDDVIAEHHRLSPNCPLLNNTATESNISIHENETPTASGAVRTGTQASETLSVPFDNAFIMLESTLVSKLQQTGGEGVVAGGDTLQAECIVRQPTQEIERHEETNLLLAQRDVSSVALTGTHSTHNIVPQPNIARVTPISTNETTMAAASSNAMIQRQQLIQPSSAGTFSNWSHPPENLRSMEPTVSGPGSFITTPVNQNTATSTATSSQIGAMPSTTSNQIGATCTTTGTQIGTSTAVPSMQLKSESGYAYQIADPTAGVVVANPKHPDYSSMEARISSYIGWPEYLDQTPRQMAEAGLYFVGVADFTRCFACGGGLRNWEIGDDPVLEHTRWFPRCEYINKLKGERYVQAVERRHRAHMARQQELQNEISERKAAQQTSLDAVNTRASSVLKEMGYTIEKIREAINAVQQQTGLSNISPEQALAWILADEDISKTTSQTRSTDASASTNDVMATEISSASASSSATAASLVVQNKHPATTFGSSDTKQYGQRNKKKKGKSFTQTSVSLTPSAGTLSEQNTGSQSLLIENERLKERQTCKICMEQQVNTTLLPCGHLITCESCAKRLKKCAICRTKIQSTIKIFMS